MMQLIHTTISADSIQMRLADDTDPAKATEWVEFRVPLAKARAVTPSSKAEYALDPVHSRTLVVIREAALRYARSAIDAEIGPA